MTFLRASVGGETSVESEKLYRAIFDTVPVSIWEVDCIQVKLFLNKLKAAGIRELRAYFSEHPEEIIKAAGLARIVNVNDRTLRLFEANSKAELLNTWTFLIIPESLPPLLNALIALAEGQSHFEAEAAIQTLLRKYLTCLFTFSFPVDGAPFGNLLVSITDITERKAAEEELRFNNEILKNVAEGIFLVGLEDGIIKWANARFEKMFGYEPGEMIGKNVAIVNAPAQKTPEETRNEIVDVLKETGEWHGEVNNIKKNGASFWCYANVSLFDHSKYGRVMVSIHIDISARKRAEKALYLREWQYLKQFEEATDAIFLADAKTGIILDCNIAATKLVERKKSEILGMPQKFLHPAEAVSGKFTRNFMKHVRGEPSEVIEEKVITKSGQVKIVAVKATKIVFQGKEIMQGIFRDVTEQKRAAEILRQKDEQYRKQFEEAIDPILIADPKTGIILDCNIAAALFFEREKSELVGMHQSQLHANKDMVDGITRTFKKHVSEEKPIAVPEKLLTKSGQVKDVLIRGSKIIVGDKEILQGFFHDITAQKLMEDKLRQSLADLRLAQRIAGVASWSWDVKKDKVTWSEELYQITGMDQKHFVPTYAKLPQLYTPESWQKLRRAVEKALADGISYELELEIVRPDGEHRWTLAFGEPVGNTTGHPVGLFGVVFDITERKQMELAKKNLVIDVSHSLKTPLAMIEMALNMSKEGIKSNNLKRIEKGQFIAYENVAKSRKYISSMLEAFTVDLRELNLEKKRKKVSLKKVVNKIYKEIELAAEERGIKLKMDIPVTANMVKAGERELSVILENLIDNALKFTYKGSVLVTGRRKKKWIEIRIKDTGCGIDPHNKVKLFEMFSKCYTVVEGLGLGLFICKRLTDLLGGEIQIESKGLNKGAEITLRLPC